MMKRGKKKKKGLIRKGKIPFSNKIEIKIFTCEVEFHRFWETCKDRREKISVLNILRSEIDGEGIKYVAEVREIKDVFI